MPWLPARSVQRAGRRGALRHVRTRALPNGQDESRVRRGDGGGLRVPPRPLRADGAERRRRQQRAARRGAGRRGSSGRHFCVRRLPRGQVPKQRRARRLPGLRALRLGDGSARRAGRLRGRARPRLLRVPQGALRGAADAIRAPGPRAGGRLRGVPGGQVCGGARGGNDGFPRARDRGRRQRRRRPGVLRVHVLPCRAAARGVRRRHRSRQLRVRERSLLVRVRKELRAPALSGGARAAPC